MIGVWEWGFGQLKIAISYFLTKYPSNPATMILLNVSVIQFIGLGCHRHDT
jgi:hypothetical protein